MVVKKRIKDEQAHPMLRCGLWYVVSLSVFGIDQYSKFLIQKKLVLHESLRLCPFFSFTLMHNPGAAFSFLSEQGGWQRWLFTLVSVVALICFGYWLRQTQKWQKLLAFGISLILGGALGNLYDRIQLGYVIDFLSVHYQNWFFPVFNLADSAITLGAVCVLLDIVCGHRPSVSD